MQNDLARLATYAGFLSCMVIFLAAGGTTPLRGVEDWLASTTQFAAVFSVPSITVNDITTQYQGTSATVSVKSKKTNANSKVHILIVPGHQPDKGGTEFNGVHERDLVVDIADSLAQLLSRNPHYEVMVARTKSTWNPTLQTYFDTHATDIQAFIDSQKLEMATHVADGSFLVEPNQVEHTTTPPLPALQLYGINKWASENNVDITLHLHVNDYDRRKKTEKKYDGFAVYVPDHQYSNGEASKPIGAAIAARLGAYHATSTLPREDVGVVEDQELIATGSNNTADDAALLIEYGYIYEPQFQNSLVRPLAVTDYAYATYLGLQDFFKDSVPVTFGSVSFPYDWSNVRLSEGAASPGVYALQAALHHLGYYPPAGKSFSECPVSGVSGDCTHDALVAYQTAHGLEATGTLGPKTRTALDQDLAAP